MRPINLAAAFALSLAVSPVAFAQTAPGTQMPPANTAPVAGANSFTEGQARSRIEAAGFATVTDLQKDDQGVWRGRATRNGAAAAVSLDFQGNVTEGSAPAVAR
jgi:hypothetical protein